MSLMQLVIFLVIGGVAGWLAGILKKGDGFGLVGNIVIGTLGAIVGGFVFKFFGVSFAGLIGDIITAAAGAVILLYVFGLFKKL